VIYRREIDGLRALAVVPVILFHAGFETFSGGFVGVDVFFVISGYLITSIILSEKEAGNFSLVRFYERRARRILPALFLVLALCIPFAWLWLQPKEMKDFSESVGAVALFLSNQLFLSESGYFDTAAELKPLLHTWSLAVEEQYYLLFPLLIMATWRFGKRSTVGLLVVIAVLSLALAQWAAYNKPEAAFFILPTRAWELAIGAFTAFHFARRQETCLSNGLQQAGSAAGLLLIVFAVFAFGKGTPFPGLYALVPTLGAALIVLFAFPSTLVGAMLGSKAFVGIGLISYSAYLWHQPLFAFARQRSLYEPGQIVFALLALAAVMLAYLSWRFIEQPFRQGDRISRTTVFRLAIFCSACFLGFGLWGHLSNGFASIRFNELQNSVFATAKSSPKRNQCHTAGRDYLRPEEACRYQTGEASWAVFGNSHGVELAYGLSELLKANGKGLRHFTFSNCPPSFGRSDEDRSGCARWTNETVEYIANDRSIQHVVISYRTHELLSPHDPQARAGGDMARWKSYVDTVRRLVDANKNVIVVLQAPELVKHIHYFIGLERKNFDFVSGVSKDLWMRSSAFVQSRIADLPREAIIIDPTNLFCTNTECAAVIAGKALYFDKHHMSVAGSLIVAAEIMKRADAKDESKQLR